MPRLTEVSPSDVEAPHVLSTYSRHFGDRDPTQRQDEEGAVGSWWTVFALEPGVFQLILDRHQWQMSDSRELDSTLRELALARTGWASESAFVYSQHSKALARLGVDDERIAGLASWTTRSCYSSVERLVLGYADGLVLNGGRIGDDLFADLKRELSEVAILELTYVVTTYLQSSVICRALRLESDDVPDRVSNSFITPDPPAVGEIT